MKSLWFTSSIALNLVLGAFVLLGRSYPPTASGSEIPLPGDDGAPRSVSAEPSPSPALDLGESTPRFHWSQVESDDYRLYIANLRAIDVPELTIRDIIVADIGQLYDQRRADRRSHLQQNSSGSMTAPSLAQLDREEQEVLDILLGPGWDLDRMAVTVPNNSELSSLLSPELLAAARRIHETYQDLEEGVRERAGLFLLPADRDELLALGAARRAALIQTLGEDGYRDYEFHTSDLGRAVQDNPYFTWHDATEARDVFEVLLRFEEAQEVASRVPAQEADGWLAQAEAERNQALKIQFGDDRYVAYQRSLDFRYQQLQDMLVGRWGLDPGVAVAVYEAQHQFEASSSGWTASAGLVDSLPALLGEEAASAVGELLRTWAN